jgi:NAD(P)H-dependent FMN reductase
VPGSCWWSASDTPIVNNIHTIFLCFLLRLLIVDAFLHPNGGINAAQQLRLIFAELGAPSISSSFTIPRVHKAIDEDGRLMDEAYDKRVLKFLEEYEWYIEAFKNQRNKGTPY